VFYDRANRLQNTEVEPVEEVVIDNALTAYIVKWKKAIKEITDKKLQMMMLMMMMI